jgi:O-antigen/teichoic acid export membrane protein
VNIGLRHYLYLLLSQGLRVPLGVANVALLARIAGPDGIGQWAIVMAVTSILHSLLLSWTQAPHVRYGREEWTATGSLRRTWSGRWPSIAAGLAVACALLVVQSGTALGRFLRLPAHWWPILVGSLLSLWLAAEAQSLMQIMGRMTRLAFAPVLVMGSSASLLVVLHARGTAGIGGALAGIVPVTVAAWGTIWWLEFRNSRAGLPRPDRRALVECLAFGWPMIPALLIGYLSDWGDHLLLQLWFSAREVGLFQSAYQVLQVTAGLAVPLTTLLLPRLIDQQLRDPLAAERSVDRVFPTVAILWALLVLPAVALLPALFLAVLGERFAEAVPPVCLLVVAVPSAAVTQLYGVLYTLQGRIDRTVLVLAAMTALNLTLSILLVPRWGPPGAALATSLSYLLSQYLYLTEQHAFLKVPRKRMLLLFATVTATAVIQGMVSEPWSLRLAVAFVGMVVLVGLARRHALVDGEVLRIILSGRLQRAGEWSARLLCPSPVR